jgi:hypothetical protein
MITERFLKDQELADQFVKKLKISEEDRNALCEKMEPAKSEFTIKQMDAIEQAAIHMYKAIQLDSYSIYLANLAEFNAQFVAHFRELILIVIFSNIQLIDYNKPFQASAVSVYLLTLLALYNATQAVIEKINGTQLPLEDINDKVIRHFNKFCARKPVEIENNENKNDSVTHEISLRA